MQLVIILFVALATALVMIGRNRTGDGARDTAAIIGVDLPCPWCNAATAETDTACPACGQPFGE